MFNRRKCLRSFYRLLTVLTMPDSEKYLEVYLDNGKKLYLKVEVTNTPDDQVKPRLSLVKSDSSD